MQLLEFSLLDDFINLFDSDSEPRSIHIEIRASGQIDPVQMQAAFAAVVALQPLLRAQRMPRLSGLQLPKPAAIWCAPWAVMPPCCRSRKHLRQPPSVLWQQR